MVIGLLISDFEGVALENLGKIHVLLILASQTRHLQSRLAFTTQRIMSPRSNECEMVRALSLYPHRNRPRAALSRGFCMYVSKAAEWIRRGRSGSWNSNQRDRHRRARCARAPHKWYRREACNSGQRKGRIFGRWTLSDDLHP